MSNLVGAASIDNDRQVLQPGMDRRASATILTIGFLCFEALAVTEVVFVYPSIARTCAIVAVSSLPLIYGVSMFSILHKKPEYSTIP